jgi:fatty acid desaturase
LGMIGFFVFAVSPRLWMVWHNRVHHGNTMDPVEDPDCYPSLADHRARRSVRVLDAVAMGRRRLRGLLSLFVGYSVQSVHALFQVGGDRRHMARREQLLAGIESVAMLAAWAGLGVWLGGRTLLFAWAIPVLLANVLLTGYILTNHSLSPYTDVNDPLANSLSVTLPRPLEILHLNFGYHVEHHLFPSMSPHHAPAVRRLLEARWPGRYQSMPFLAALVALHRTPRIHLDASTLIDPATGERFTTIGVQPQVVAPPAPVEAEEPLAPLAVA